MSDTTFDYIIVGGGTAGALLANRLSNDRDMRVLLLEAGRKDDFHWIHLPVGQLRCQHNPRTDWCFQTEPVAGLQQRRMPLPRGKALGGSSSIDGMQYLRGQAHDYHQWAQLTGDDSWAWDQVLPDFMRHEQHWRLDTNKDGHALYPHNANTRTHHGDQGEWRVDRPRVHWDIAEAFRQATLQLGVPPRHDFNTGDNAGVGYFDLTQRQGLRWNSAKAFLRPRAYARPNFELWTMARATQLVTTRQPDGSLHCTGVKVWDGTEMVQLSATEEVLLCAGALNTPQLLQLSGIGPAELLHQCGIPLALDAPGVGANLQDHLQLRQIFHVQGANSLNTLAHSRWGQLRMGLEFVLRRSGPISMASAPLGAFVPSAPDAPRANLQLQVHPLSWEQDSTQLHTFPAFTASVHDLHPTSRGSVQVDSPDFEAAPRIQPNYLDTAQDRQVAAEGLRWLQRVVAQPALAAYRPQAFTPTPASDRDDDLLAAAAPWAQSLGHPVGTTRMGRDGDAMAVLDSRLRVRGVQALRVVDTGAMPTLPSGNLTAPALMLAEKAAGWIRADRKARHAASAIPAAAPALSPTPADAPASTTPAPAHAEP